MPPSYNLVGPNGERVTVAEDALAGALNTGFRLERSDEGVQRAAIQGAAEENQRRYGGVLGGLQAGAQGLLRGATLGLSDAVQTGLGGDASREQLLGLREANPGISKATELVGAAAPAFLTGGESTLAGLARLTPAGAASRVATGIAGEAAVGGGIARTAIGVGRTAAGGAFEGAAQNVGSYLSTAALEDKDLSAEGFYAAAKGGAVPGAAFGGALGLAERGFVKARELLPKHQATADEVARAADNVDAELSQALAAGDDAVQAAKGKLEILRLQKAELDAAAQRMVLERRAAEAARAQGAVDLQAQRLATQRELDAVRIERAKQGRPAKPKASDQAPAEGAGGGDVVETTADAVGAATDAPVADDVVGAPIGNASPTAAGSDLEALLAQSASRLKAGETLADLKPAAKVPTALDDVHLAMAELDPEAAKLVQAVQAQEKAAHAITTRWRVRAPHGEKGSTMVGIADLPDLTLGRVKQAYVKATEAERLAILDAIGPEKARALTEIVDGKRTFDKWYRNKGHAFADDLESSMPPRWYQERVGPTADELGDFPPHAMVRGDLEGAHPGPEDLARMADEGLDADALDTMGRMGDEIATYERASADLADALGADAPIAAAERAKAYTGALDEQGRKAMDRMLQVTDEMPIPSPVLAEGSGPILSPFSHGEDKVAGSLADAAPPRMADLSSPTPRSDALMADLARAEGSRRAADLVSLPGGAKPPGKASGALGKLADLGAAGEALQAIGVAVPFLPDVDRIPVVGKLLKGYLQLRAGMAVLGRAGFKVPLSGEAAVARGAAKTRERMVAGMDKVLGASAKAVGVVRPIAAAQGWRVVDVLKETLAPGSEKQRKVSGETPSDLARARIDEVATAAANPAQIRAAVRAQLRDVRDPDVVVAVENVAQRKYAYLDKHKPIVPPASPFARSQWAISPVEIERWSRRVRAANDPASVIEDISAGRVTPEAAETLREVYPRLYGEVRERLLSQAVKLNADLPHQVVVRLSVLLDAPLSSAMEPENLAAIQSVGTPAPADPAAPPPMQPPPAGAPDLSSLYSTDAQARAVR